MRLPLAALSLGLFSALSATAAPPVTHEAAYQSTAAALSRLAPDANPRVLALALQARDCAAAQSGEAAAPRLAVIDYSKPSLEKRLWVFDLASNTLLFHEVVAHGQGSGENLANAFSNRDGSHQTSLGLFRTGETYQGSNGYSMRMVGLEPGVNDAAMSRAIVMHGAPYVNLANARKQGRLGRSFGCPAVRSGIVREVVDSLKGGQLLFAYYPEMSWLKDSRFLACDGAGDTKRVIASIAAAPAG